MAARLRFNDGRLVDLASDRVTIGRSPAANVCVQTGQGIAEKHCLLRKVGSRWLIEVDQGDCIVVKGEETRFAWISPGDRVELVRRGPSFQLELDSAPARAESEESPGQREVQETSSAQKRDILSPVLIGAGVTVCLALVIGVSVWLLRSGTRTAEPEPVENEVVQAPQVPKPESPTAAPADPRDYLVLVGIKRPGVNQDPLVMGVGWLWDESTVIVSAELIKGIRESQAALMNRGETFDLCVVQGQALEIAKSAERDSLAALRLTQPAILNRPLESELGPMSAREANLSVERGKSFEGLSYTPFQLNSRTVPVVAYHPSATWIAAGPVKVLVEGDKAFMTELNSDTPLLPGGLILNSEHQIIGASLLDRTVLWSDQIRSHVAGLLGAF